MLQGSVDWWIMNRVSLFDPGSYLLITAGIITYLFLGLSIWRETLQARVIKQKTLNFEKNVNSHDSNPSEKSIEIANLKRKISKFENKLAMSKNQINNLKENMNYLIKIINDSQSDPTYK